MARDGITQLWGGKALEFPARLLKVAFPAVVAVPLAFVSLGIADNVHVPNLLRLFVSPGYLLGVYAVPPHVGFWNSVLWFLAVGMATNMAYYALLLVCLLRIRERRIAARKRFTFAS